MRRALLIHRPSPLISIARHRATQANICPICIMKKPAALAAGMNYEVRKIVSEEYTYTGHDAVLVAGEALSAVVSVVGTAKLVAELDGDGL